MRLENQKIQEFTNISQNNVQKVKEFMENVTSKSNTLKNKKISAIKNAESLKILKESGFFGRF